MKRWQSAKIPPFVLVTLSPTNWTFGIWWSRGTISRRRTMIGVDIGPLELMWEGTRCR